MEKAASMVWPTLDPRPFDACVQSYHQTVSAAAAMFARRRSSHKLAYVFIHMHGRHRRTRRMQCQPRPRRRPSASCIAAADEVTERRVRLIGLSGY